MRLHDEEESCSLMRHRASQHAAQEPALRAGMASAWVKGTHTPLGLHVGGAAGRMLRVGLPWRRGPMNPNTSAT